MDLLKFDINNIESRKLYSDLEISNQRPDDIFKKDKIEITHSIFENIGFRNSKIANSDLTHNIFINCYFKKAEIWNVDFTGSKFINCQFDDISIQHSDFIYSSFENSYINYDSMFSNLPREFNLREKLCRNLALESLKFGRDNDYKKYYFEQRKSRENHCYETFRLKQKPYYKQKTTYQRLLALIEFLLSKFSKIVWGYGEYIQRLLFSMFILIVGFSTLYYNNVGNIINADQINYKLSYRDTLYLSFCNFFGLDTKFYTIDKSLDMIISFQGFIGLVFVGCFITALYKNISRR